MSNGNPSDTKPHDQGKNFNRLWADYKMEMIGEYFSKTDRNNPGESSPTYVCISSVRHWLAWSLAILHWLSTNQYLIMHLQALRLLGKVLTEYKHSINHRWSHFWASIYLVIVSNGSHTLKRKHHLSSGTKGAAGV